MSGPDMPLVVIRGAVDHLPTSAEVRSLLAGLDAEERHRLRSLLSLHPGAEVELLCGSGGASVWIADQLVARRTTPEGDHR